MAFTQMPNKPNAEDLKIVTGDFSLSNITQPIEKLLAENAIRVGAIRDRFASVRAELDNIKYQLTMSQATSKPFEYLMEIEAALRRLDAIVPANTKK